MLPKLPHRLNQYTVVETHDVQSDFVVLMGNSKILSPKVKIYQRIVPFLIFPAFVLALRYAHIGPCRVQIFMTLQSSGVMLRLKPTHGSPKT